MTPAPPEPPEWLSLLVEELQVPYPQMRLTLAADEAAATMVLALLWVPEQLRGQGHGAHILERVCAEADVRGLAVHTDPDAGLGADLERLQAWYRRHGFAPEAPGARYPWRRRPRPSAPVDIVSALAAPVRIVEHDCPATVEIEALPDYLVAEYAPAAIEARISAEEPTATAEPLRDARRGPVPSGLLRPDAVEGLPEPIDQRRVIVSADVAAAARGRRDLVVPAAPVHTPAGAVIAYRRLDRIHWDRGGPGPCPEPQRAAWPVGGL